MLVQVSDACYISVLGHDRERLGWPFFQPAQPRDRPAIGGVAGNVKSTNAFYGDYLPVLEQRCGFRYSMMSIDHPAGG